MLLLRKVLAEKFKDRRVAQIQVTDGTTYIYISVKQPRKKIMRPTGTSVAEWDVSAEQDPKTRLWVWTF